MEAPVAHQTGSLISLRDFFHAFWYGKAAAEGYSHKQLRSRTSSGTGNSDHSRVSGEFRRRAEKAGMRLCRASKTLEGIASVLRDPCSNRTELEQSRSKHARETSHQRRRRLLLCRLRRASSTTLRNMVSSHVRGKGCDYHALTEEERRFLGGVPVTVGYADDTSKGMASLITSISLTQRSASVCREKNRRHADIRGIWAGKEHAAGGSRGRGGDRRN